MIIIMIIFLPYKPVCEFMTSGRARFCLQGHDFMPIDRRYAHTKYNSCTLTSVRYIRKCRFSLNFAEKDRQTDNGKTICHLSIYSGIKRAGILS